MHKRFAKLYGFACFCTYTWPNVLFAYCTVLLLEISSMLLWDMLLCRVLHQRRKQISRQLDQAS